MLAVHTMLLAAGFNLSGKVPCNPDIYQGNNTIESSRMPARKQQC